MVMDEVGISTTPIMKKKKAQPEDEVEAIRDRGMTNSKYSAIIVKSLGIMLQHVELQVLELMKRVNYIEEKNGKNDTLLLARNNTREGQEKI